ncbi:MAG: glycine cleavage system protein [Chloroflexota bacterium]|jgi:glycine cleavage system H protein|nr:glycine cleavage system protein [Chloroflexota bacterium]
MDTSKYRFSKSHEWVSVEGDVARIGITEYAQSQLGDVIYVELPKPGTEVAAGGKFGVIESVKAASDLYSPVSGRVKQANPALTQAPESVNSEPYEGGWMLELELTESLSAELLDEAGYRTFTEGL